MIALKHCKDSTSKSSTNNNKVGYIMMDQLAKEYTNDVAKAEQKIRATMSKTLALLSIFGLAPRGDRPVSQLAQYFATRAKAAGRSGRDQQGARRCRIPDRCKGLLVAAILPFVAGTMVQEQHFSRFLSRFDFRPFYSCHIQTKTIAVGAAYWSNNMDGSTARDLLASIDSVDATMSRK
jgi:hypothetical protein